MSIYAEDVHLTLAEAFAVTDVMDVTACCPPLVDENSAIRLRIQSSTAVSSRSYAQEALIRVGIVHGNVGGWWESLSMTSSTDLLLAGTEVFAAEWAGALCAGGGATVGGGANVGSVGGVGGVLGGGAVTVADVGMDVERMSDAGLLRTLEAGFAAKRLADSLLVRLAGEVAWRSRPILGAVGLSMRTGSGRAAALVSDVGHVTGAEAARLCSVGEATAARVSLLGERMPAFYPLVGAALDAGTIPVDSAQWIVSNLAQATPRADADDLVAAETELTEFAALNPADIVRKLSIRWRDALDVDGVQPREEVLVARRGLRRSNLADGMKQYVLKLDPVGAGFMDAAIDAQVGAALRKVRFEAGLSPDGCADDHEELTDGRTIEQTGADAVVDLARHCLSCTEGPGPLPDTEMVVRITLESLMTGLGEAQIDGSLQPISAATARRLAANARIIPMVLGGEGEVLDLGVGRRLFSHAQRLAFAERDDGCAWANCTRPPTHTEAHHIKWWSQGGRTNLSNGLLVCSLHHHRIHQDGWGIRVEDNVVWFIPPSRVDIDRKPRRGGRLPAPAPPSRNR